MKHPSRELTDKRLAHGSLFSRTFVEQLLRDAWNAGYHSAMTNGGADQWNQSRIKSLESDIENLRIREREATIQFQLAKQNLDSIRRQMDQLFNMMDLARQGQLDLDVRPEPDL